jgi:hypothetical protein
LHYDGSSGEYQQEGSRGRKQQRVCQGFGSRPFSTGEMVKGVVESAAELNVYSQECE